MTGADLFNLTLRLLPSWKRQPDRKRGHDFRGNALVWSCTRLDRFSALLAALLEMETTLTASVFRLSTVWQPITSTRSRHFFYGRRSAYRRP
jgi:hypothetical protein